MMSILSDDEIEAIGRQEWSLDATLVMLRCPRWGKTLMGKGQLGMDKQGFILRFYPTTTAGFDVFKEAMSFPPLGQIIPETWYAVGLIKDLKGRRWILTRFLPRYQVIDEEFVIYGHPLIIRCKRRAAKPLSGHHGHLCYFPSLKFPANTRTAFSETIAGKVIRSGTKLNAAQVEVNDIKFTFMNREYGECLVNSEAALMPQNWSTRICEALQFITARWHEWTIAGEWKGKMESVFVRMPQLPESSRIKPPLHSASPAEAIVAWAMFGDYLRFVWNKQEDSLHSISNALRSVIRAGEASIEAEAIQLSVSIERILRSEFAEAKRIVTVDPNQLRRAKLAIKFAFLNERIHNRVIGAIDSIMNPRAKEVAGVLVSQGRLRKKLLSIYSKLRNPSVHGSTAYPKSSDLQKWIDRCSSGLVMLYELIFARINYVGPYTDHSNRESPSIQYPPEST